MRRIYVTNQSKRISDTDVKAMTKAVDSQVYYHAAPAYGYKPNRVYFTTNPASVKAPDVVLVVTDTPDEEGVLGWHSEQDGVAYGYVFVSPVLDNGGDALHDASLSVSSVLSHEVLETYLDSGCDVYADDGHGRFWSYEVADPVEGDSYPIFTSQIMVSNFVLPAFFDQQGAAPFDYMAKLTKPFSLSRGGYAVVVKEGTASQIYGDKFNETILSTRSYPDRKPSENAIQ